MSIDNNISLHPEKYIHSEPLKLKPSIEGKVFQNWKELELGKKEFRLEKIWTSEIPSPKKNEKL